jgi:hypothetical protein
LFIGGNSPSSSNRKHCLGGDSVAAAISWNFSESAEENDTFEPFYYYLLLFIQDIQHYIYKAIVHHLTGFFLKNSKKISIFQKDFKNFKNNFIPEKT